MKRILIAFLALFLLLSGCKKAPVTPDPSDVAPENAEEILTVLLELVPEGQEDPEILLGDQCSLYLQIYGIDPAIVADCAIARLGGAKAFELAVLELDRVDAASEGALLNYLLRRWADFGGYDPMQASIAADGKLFSSGGGTRLILSLSEDNDAVLDGLLQIPGISPVTMVDQAPPFDEMPDGRFPYTDPGIDDMTLYDTTAILDAWHSGDPSDLSDYDRAIYDKASAVIAKVIKDSMSHLQKETAIYKWITTNVEYDYDHYDPAVQLSPDSSTPYNPLMEGKGICLGFAVTFQLFMDMLDIECITVAGASSDSSENHAWNMVRLNENWYCVDSTWDAGLPQKYWMYFNVTSDYMADNQHQWDYDAIPEATATDHGKG